MRIEVTKCEECPLYSRDIDDSEYCSKGGSPDTRYPDYMNNEKMSNIPLNCPLLTESVMIKLSEE